MLTGSLTFPAGKTADFLSHTCLQRLLPRPWSRPDFAVVMYSAMLASAYSKDREWAMQVPAGPESHSLNLHFKAELLDLQSF